MRVLIKATAGEPIKQAGYTSATSETTHNPYCERQAVQYIGHKQIFRPACSASVLPLKSRHVAFTMEGLLPADFGACNDMCHRSNSMAHSDAPSTTALLPQAGRAAVPAPANFLATAPAPLAPTVAIPPAMAMTALHLDHILRGRTLTSRPRLSWQRKSRRGEHYKENSKHQFAHSKSSSNCCVNSVCPRLAANQGSIEVAREFSSLHV